MSKRVCVSGLIVLGVVYWAWPSPQGQAPQSELTRSATEQAQRRKPIRSSVATRSTQLTPDIVQDDLPTHTVKISLSTSQTLHPKIEIFNRFSPNKLLTPLNPEGIPDTHTGDVVFAWMSGEDLTGQGMEDAFLNAVLDDPDLEGFDPAWADVIDLETERLLADEDFILAEEVVMDQLTAATRLPEDEAKSVLADIPPIDRDHTEMVALAREIIDNAPLEPVADVARIYAARALSDPMSARPYEGKAANALLDTLASSEDPQVHSQAIGMMVGLSPGVLNSEDIDLLEHSWFMVDDNERSQLSRFLMSQHFANGELSDAQMWTDRFEAEVLSDEMTLPARAEFLQEAQHAKARIGARLGNPAQSWRVAAEQAAWHCWEGPSGARVEERDGRLRIEGVWDESWQLTPSPADHPLVDCLMPELIDTVQPTHPMRVSIHIKMFGIQN